MSNYVVLARKYRPQTLSEVIGQDAVVQTLKNAITLRRIHHAYLFTGARGVGKTSIARILAKSLNCEKGPTDSPCGVCAACVEITKSASPDVLEIDGASNTGVDDVRDLRETVKYLPSRGKHKIYIIDEVHMLSTAAFNALLKTLEEPPEHVIFVFATTEPHKIPITILSRCQRFDFRRVPQSVLADRLRFVADEEHVTIDAPALQAIAKAADGSVRDAMSLFDQVIAFCGDKITVQQAQQALGLLDREKVRGLLAAILERDRQRVSQLVQEANATGADLSEISERLVEAVRDLTLAKLTNGQAETLSALMPEELQSLRDAATALSPADLHRLFNVIVKTAEDTAKSPFSHLTFEMGLLRACDLEPVAALADLVNALRGGDVPSGGGGGSGPQPRGPVQKTVINAPQASFVATAPPPEAPKPRLEATKPIEAPSTASPTAVPPATAPTAPPASKPSSYKAFASAVLALKPVIGAALENVACEAFTDAQIVVRVPQGNEVFGELLRDKETQATLAEICERLFGRRMGFDVIIAPATAPAKTIADERRQERNAEVSELKSAGAAHPAVRKVLEVFGGEIRSVQVKAALSHPADDYD
jgi:DNA polymerase-3 subunit gamma/tau